MSVDLILQFFLAIWLWALIWMERWIKAESRITLKKVISFWEIRTFSLISFLWAISAWMSLQFNSEIILIVSMLLVWAFILIYYYFSAFKEEQLGLTTELSVFVTFFLWVFIIMWYEKVAIILSIVLTFILSLKWFLQKVKEKISRDELNNTLKFAVISLVILPLLPDQKYSIADWLGFLWYSNQISNQIINLDFFNPYWIWFFVVLMSWISYAAYIMSKIVWEKWSIVLSWAIWWLISSTAVTASMTEASKKDFKNTNLYVVATLTASTIMFIRVVLIVLFFNINMLPEIIYPSAFMFLWMLGYIFYFYYKSKDSNVSVKSSKEYKSPFSIWPALKFASFVLMIKFISWVGGLYKEYWWDYFFYALWIISWLADVDAISQTMAVDSAEQKVGLSIAAMTIIIAVISNNFVKWSIAWRFWEKKFWISVMMWFIVSMIMWVIWMVMLNIF